MQCTSFIFLIYLSFFLLVQGNVLAAELDYELNKSPDSLINEIVPIKIAVNTSDQGEFFVMLGDDDVLIAETDFKALNINLFHYTKKIIDGEVFLSLKSLSPDLTFVLNETSLVLHFKVNPKFLKETKLDLVKTPVVRRSAGGIDSAFLNYAIINRGNSEQGFQTLELPLEGVISAHDWLLKSNFTYHYSELNKQFIEAYWVRGLSSFTKDNPKKLSRFIIGDFTASSSELGGSGVFLGFSYRKKFSMASYFSKYPGLTVSGILQTPSKINMYVNDVLIRSEQLPAGRYEVANLPNLYGAGSVKVEIIDAFGRRTVNDVPYYISTRLLRVGLDDYSYNIGLQRDSLNVVQPVYATIPAFLGYHRWGIKKYLTAGYRFEVSKQVSNIGVSANFLVSSFGEAEAGFSVSRSLTPTAYAGFFRYGFTSKYFHGRYSYKTTKNDYETLSTIDENNSRLSGRENTIQSIGLGIHGLKIGSLAINYSQLSSTQIRSTQFDLLQPVEARFVGVDTWSLIYSLRVGKRTSVLFRGVRTIDEEGSSDVIFASINSTFGKKTSMSMSHIKQQSSIVNSAYLQRSTPIGTGVGYRVRVSQLKQQLALTPSQLSQNDDSLTVNNVPNDTVIRPSIFQRNSLPDTFSSNGFSSNRLSSNKSPSKMLLPKSKTHNEALQNGKAVDESYLADASVQVKMKYLSVSTDFFQGETADSYQSNISGSMVFIDNDFFLSRPIYDSFGLVKVSDLDNVRIYFGNEIIDKTDEGKLIIPNLTSYADNRVSIEAFDIPIDRALKQTQKIVSPKFRAGSIALFEVERFQGFSGFLFLLKNGQERTADFSDLTLTKLTILKSSTINLKTVVGRNGEFYFENLTSGNYSARVKLAGEVCKFNLVIPSSEQMMVELGKYVCQY